MSPHCGETANSLAGEEEKWVVAEATKLQTLASKVKRKDAMRPPREAVKSAD